MNHENYLPKQFFSPTNKKKSSFHFHHLHFHSFSRLWGFLISSREYMKIEGRPFVTREALSDINFRHTTSRPLRIQIDRYKHRDSLFLSLCSWKRETQNWNLCLSLSITNGKCRRSWIKMKKKKKSFFVIVAEWKSISFQFSSFFLCVSMYYAELCWYI